MLDFELDTLPRLIAQAAEPLPDIHDPAFGSFFDRFADARVVCLGEASHGTSEFYRARAAISRRLIELRIEHADLDSLIDGVSAEGMRDELAMQRLKKRRLLLRDHIAALEAQLEPPEPA